jgi:hypothetical protein
VAIADIAVSSDPDRPFVLDPEPLDLIFLFLATLCNILLNIFASANIIIRLLIHRRSIKKSFGPTPALRNLHIRICGIILESAAINVPIAIAAATLTWTVGGFALLVWQVGVPAQVGPRDIQNRALLIGVLITSPFRQYW